MFLVRQLYLEQIYGIVVTATLAACALTGTFVTCYCATAHQRLLCGSKLWPTYLYIIQQDARVGSALAAASQEGRARLLGPAIYC